MATSATAPHRLAALRAIVIPARDGLTAYRRSALLIALVAGLALGITLPVARLASRTVPITVTRLSLPSMPGAELEAPGSLVTRSVDRTRQMASDAFYRFLVGGGVATLLLGGLTALTLGTARTRARRPEQATRRAVGASHWSQSLAVLLEGVGLLLLGLVVGVPIGVAACSVALAAWPGAVAPGSFTVVQYALGAIALLTVASVLLPYLLTPTRQLSGESAEPLTLWVPVLQLALSLIVLLGGALILRHAEQQGLAPGATGRGGMVIDLRASGTPAARESSYRRLLRQLDSSAVTGTASLTSAGTARGMGTVESVLTDCGNCFEGSIATRFRPLLVTGHLASPDTFRSLETPVVVGRGFTLRDDRSAPPVAVVTRSLAEQGFEAGGAVGRDIRIRTGGAEANPDGEWFRVVGIVEDRIAGGYGFGQQPAMGVYLSVLQRPPVQADLVLRSAVARPPVPPNGDAALEVLRSRPESEVLADDLQPLRWFGYSFAVLGWVMLSIGALGALVLMRAWLVSLIPELGLRRSVGATRMSLVRLVLGRLMLALGLAVAFTIYVAPGVGSSVASVVGPFDDRTGGLVAGYGALLALAAVLGVSGPLWHAMTAAPAQLVDHSAE